MNSPVEVVAYDPQWPIMFASEAKLIKQAFGSICLAIHHIGSTSVPGLCAKPIIDMLPVVDNILAVDECIATMESLGYDSKGENGIAFRRFFQKGREVRTHNVHVYERGDPEIERYLKFRDWLRTHDNDVQAYAKLKLELAQKFPDDIQRYCDGKDSFVASIDAQDGYEGWRMVQALTEREWAAVRDLRLQYFVNLKDDPYAWTLKNGEHVHLVFYKNANIIGYAHLQLWPQDRVAVRVFIIAEGHRHQGCGSQFLQFCERWLSHQGKRLHVRTYPR